MGEKHKSICHEDITEAADKDEENNTADEDIDPLVDENNDQGLSDQEGEWSCIQCPEVLPTKKSMMQHVATDCSGQNKSPTKEASDQVPSGFDVTDEITDETAPPNKKSRKDDEKDDPSWTPQITNVWSKNNKGEKKLTARKSTGGKAPKDSGKILKCEKCNV